MGERRGTKGLELWCRKMTEGYPGVKIDNMTTSWRDGLAFCAIIHHFRPDLIDFSKLNKNDIYHNNELAFRVAEQYLGIPALLEPEDMVEFPVPDRLSILTYLSQFYQAFAVTQGSAATRIPAKRPQTTTDHGIVSPASTSPPTKPTAESCVGVEKSMRKLLLKELKSIAYHGTGSKVRREPCAKCGLPVFIAERLNVGKLLYHRTCFRCARCDSQLNLANYYETENNEFCCEMCPDEEKARVTADPLEKSVLARSMSDEEKSALNQLKCSNQEDEYSSQFESALENPSDSSLKRNFTLTTEQSSEYSMARSRFFESQIGDSASDNDEPPDLPKSKPPTVDNSNENSIVSNNSAYDSGFPTTKLDSSVNSVSDNVNIGSKFVEDEKIVTKDIDKEITHSTVKSRVRLFENNIKSEDVNKDVPVPLELPQDSQIHSSLEYDRSKHSDRDNILNSDVSVTNVLGENVDLTTNILGDNINLTSYIENDTQKVDPIDDSITDEIEFIDDDEHSLKTANDYKDTDLKSITENSDLIDDGNVSISSKCNEEIKDSNSKISAETVNVSDSNVMHTSMNLKNSELPQNELKGAADDIDIIIDTKVDINKESNQIVIFPEESETTQEDQLPPVVPLPRKHKKKVKKQTSYPEDLNPFGDDLETSINPDMSLNPFGDDDEEEEELSRPIPSPRLRRKMDTAETVNSTLRNPNPFEDEEEEKDQKIETKPPLPTNRKKLIEVPKISLNPFGSDDEDEEDAGNVKIPVPTPRNSSRVPEPKPRYESGTTATSSSAGGFHSSLSSGNSAGQTNTFRKKKLAPKPPSSVISDATESGHSSLTSSPSQSVAPSPSVTPKYRKAKKAPPPPSSSTPVSNITETNNYLSTSTSVSPLPSKTAENVEEDFDKEKSAKDEMNRNRQSQNLNIQSPTSSETSSSICTPNKSTYGKWKRRKGQAPQRPIPQRRSIKALPMAEIRRELEIIEIQQQGLEKQGVMIEQIIRERSENNTNPDEPLSVELEDMILQLFELVNEKNELFRKQAELMYLRRQQRLEEEHADVEYQIRCLMLQPEANKTDSDKEREEELINRLVEIVERRNEIIECLEMDRVREAQEDDSINNQMNLYTSKREEEKTPTEKPKKEKKKHKITKEKLKEKFHFRKEKEKDHKVDVDKDIDESETPTEKDKEKKKKKKLNIF